VKVVISQGQIVYIYIKIGKYSKGKNRENYEQNLRKSEISHRTASARVV